LNRTYEVKVPKNYSEATTGPSGRGIYARWEKNTKPESDETSESYWDAWGPMVNGHRKIKTVRGGH